MATISFTSAATQAEAYIPERGYVTGVTVNGAPYSFRQNGPDDLSIDFAPALKGGQSVVITYTATPAVANNLEEVNSQLALKASASAVATLVTQMNTAASRLDGLDSSVLSILTQITAALVRLTAVEAAVAAGGGSGGGGGSLPTYTGASGSTVYFNLDAGVLATIQVTRDGVDIPGAVSAASSNSYAYTLVQADDGKLLTVRLTDITYDVAPPVRYSIQITDAERDTIEIVYSKTMQLSPINLAHFILAGTIATGKTLVSATVTNNVLKLKYSGPFVYGDVPNLTLAVTGSNDFTDYAGNLAPTFTNLAVANNIELGVVPQALPVNGVFLNDGTDGYFAELGGITSHGFGGPYFDYAAPMQSTAVNGALEAMHGDGWIEMQCSDSSAVERQLMLANYDSSNNAFKCPYQVRLASGSIQAYRGMANAPTDAGSYSITLGSPFAFPTPSATCWARLRRFGDAVTVEYSTNNKATWTVLYTYPDSEVDPLFAHLNVIGTGTAMKGAGLVGFTAE